MRRPATVFFTASWFRPVMPPNPVVEMGLEVEPPQLRKDFCQVVGQEAVAGGVVLGADLRDLPPRQVGVDAVEECRVLEVGGEDGEEVLVMGGGCRLVRAPRLYGPPLRVISGCGL